MEKVYISRYSKKGEPLVSAIGLVDTNSKTILVPKVSRKGIPYIDTIVVNYLEEDKDGYLGTEICENEDGRKFYAYYRLTLLKKGGDK